MKLEALAARGMRVTVASPVRRRAAAATRLEGVELKRIPGTGERWLTLLPGLLADGFALAVTNPRRLRDLVNAVRRTLPAGRRGARARQMLTSLRRFLPLARLRPDVVQFEWSGWAVDYLPLIEAWGLPVLTSCRGSAVNVRPLDPAYGDLARGLPASFALATAVHCVSEEMERTADATGSTAGRAA